MFVGFCRLPGVGRYGKGSLQKMVFMIAAGRAVQTYEIAVKKRGGMGVQNFVLTDD